MDPEEIQDLLLLMKNKWEEFVYTRFLVDTYMQRKIKKEVNPKQLFVNFKLKTKKKMFSGKKQFYFQVKVGDEENKNKITLADILNNEEDFLLAMKKQ